jgi:thiol-disulfide isomerase/thioredoxin
MKTPICYLVVLMFITGCTSKKEYFINGSIIGEQNEKWIYLVKFMKSNPTIDSAKIENGKFKFSGKIDVPEIYGIHYHPERIRGVFPIFVEAAKLNVVIDPNNWVMGSSVTGGKINETYNDLEKTRIEKYIKEIWSLNEKKASVGAIEQKSIEKRINKLWDEDFKNQLEYVESHPESPISIFILSKFYLVLPLEELGRTLSRFTPALQKTSIYEKISDFYKNELVLKNSAPVYLNSSGIKMLNIEFEGSSVIQTLIKLHPQKVLYVDIWATWCSPCLKEFPNSRKLYQRIDTTKVAFVYLCVRSEKEIWKKMIAEEKLKGQHYLLNKEQSDSLSVSLGGIYGIPRYFIIGKNGEIKDANAPTPSSNKIEKVLMELSK